jgi:hypothetical protein
MTVNFGGDPTEVISGTVVAGRNGTAWIAFRFSLASVVDPPANDPVWGFLMASGFCVSVAVAVAGAVIIARERGIWTPPV